MIFTAGEMTTIIFRRKIVAVRDTLSITLVAALLSLIIPSTTFADDTFLECPAFNSDDHRRAKAHDMRIKIQKPFIGTDNVYLWQHEDPTGEVEYAIKCLLMSIEDKQCPPKRFKKIWFKTQSEFSDTQIKFWFRRPGADLGWLFELDRVSGQLQEFMFNGDKVVESNRVLFGQCKQIKSNF